MSAHEGRGNPVGPKRCQRFKAIADRLDKAIGAEKYKSENLPNKRQRAAARREWEEGNRVKSKTLNAHVDSCLICDPLQTRPVHCPSYTQQAVQMDRQLEAANRQMQDAEDIQEKTLAQIAISRASNGKEVVLIAHVLECSMCE
ncbi:hypothetical protein [Streptomyces violaceusniger]|uniref:hypothetical protein n=1 Tax=Streptomyces violaceusniger TaxID=68280 RepID=UPI00381507CE